MQFCDNSTEYNQSSSIVSNLIPHPYIIPKLYTFFALQNTKDILNIGNILDELPLYSVFSFF